MGWEGRGGGAFGREGASPRPGWEGVRAGRGYRGVRGLGGGPGKRVREGELGGRGVFDHASGMDASRPRGDFVPRAGWKPALPARSRSFQFAEHVQTTSSPRCYRHCSCFSARGRSVAPLTNKAKQIRDKWGSENFSIDNCGNKAQLRAPRGASNRPSNKIGARRAACASLGLDGPGSLRIPGTPPPLR